jgi:hypothetical protein
VEDFITVSFVEGSQGCPTAAKAASCIAALRPSRVTANATPFDATAK